MGHKTAIIAQRTMTGATDNATTKLVRGAIKSIEIQTSASNTFWIHTVNSSLINQDLFGATGGYITVASSTVIYPRAKIKDSSNSDGSAGDNLWTEFLVDDVVQVNVASGSSSDTWSIKIHY